MGFCGIYRSCICRQSTAIQTRRLPTTARAKTISRSTSPMTGTTPFHPMGSKSLLETPLSRYLCCFALDTCAAPALNRKRPVFLSSWDTGEDAKERGDDAMVVGGPGSWDSLSALPRRIGKCMRNLLSMIFSDVMSLPTRRGRGCRREEPGLPDLVRSRTLTLGNVRAVRTDGEEHVFHTRSLSPRHQGLGHRHSFDLPSLSPQASQ